MLLTQQPAFAALQAHARQQQGLTLSARFSQNLNRFNELSFPFKDALLVDLSKQVLDTTALALLTELAQGMQVPHAIEQLFASNAFNPSEQRAVLHTALRMPANAELYHNGENVVNSVHAELNKIRLFCQRIHGGEWRGFTGKRITDVVNIGIGGSDLGPVMVCEALTPYQSLGISPHFVSNIDAAHLGTTLATLDPATTLFVVSSKSFGTDETMSNAAAAKQWLLKACDNSALVQQHFVAVSTNRQAVADFGIDPNNMFIFWDWVGGRFSLWSAIGLPIALAVGFERFEQLLQGAHEMDEHLRTTPLEQNLPVLLALLTCSGSMILDTH